MRRAQPHWPDRSHQRRDCTVLGGATRPGRAIDVGLPVAGIDRVEEDDLPLDLIAALRELVEILDDDDVRFDAVGGGRDAATEAEHRDDVMRRIENLEALAAAHPARHHDALCMHVLEAIAFHRLDGPGDRTRQVLRSREPVAERVGQLCKAVPGKLIGLGLLDQPLGVRAML
jgi:glycosyltransferase involved in cell wall biosynthesis